MDISPGFLTQYLPTNEVFVSAISANGRYVMFGGRSSDDGHPTLPFSWTNLYWRDLELNTNFFAGYFDFGPKPVLSSDGRMVAYDIVYYSPGGNWSDGNNAPDVLLYDFRGLPPAPSVISRQRQPSNTTANGPSINPTFSPDSRWVLFQSLATDLTYDTGNVSDYQIYAREIDTKFIKRISYSGSEGTNAFPLSGGATNPVFSADARFVFFEGSSNNLIYRHDLLNDMDDAGTARRPNLVVCAGCANPSASSEGRFVAYESRPGPGGSTNVFVKDLASGQVEFISVSMAGTNGNGPSFTPLLSHDARFVVFASKASDLVPGDNNRAMDIFVRDRLNGVTHCLSRNWNGTGTGNRVSSNPILSADGRTVAFQSFASDLIRGDYNDTRDVFVVTLGGPDTDSDGMEDDWEMAYFSTLARDGSGDFDNDGSNDLAEFRAGTNPANDASILRVLTLTTSLAAGPNPHRTTVLLWSASPGKTYRVQFKAGLDSTWTAVGADITAGSTTASLTDTVEAFDEPNNPHRFYRVLLVQ
jgi:Tol biopolymer transport system component